MENCGPSEGRAVNWNRSRVALALSLATTAAVFGVGAWFLLRGSDPISMGTASPTPTVEPISDARSEVWNVFEFGAGGLSVAGEQVPGNWSEVRGRRSVWVAINNGVGGATSQWWGNGQAKHRMPPSFGDVLRGGVAISPDARWIVWTRPANAYDRNPPRVMEVVETATGKVRWSRGADQDAHEQGALAVTNDGVVVFLACTDIRLDETGFGQCFDAKAKAWAPAKDVTRDLPVGVNVSEPPFAGYLPGIGALLDPSGAHNGFVVRSNPDPNADLTYVRLTDDGVLEDVEDLPARTVAVSADERFALVGPEKCTKPGCVWTVVTLDDGEQRELRAPEGTDFRIDGTNAVQASWVERDDLVLLPTVRGGPDSVATAAARCSLEQARCVLIKY